MPAPLGVAVVLTALVGHLPALASYFAQDDWDFLARGAGLVPIPEWPARVVSSVLYWKLTWPLFGLDDLAYHSVGLLLAALLAWLAARLAWRLGLQSAGSAVAGLVTAATPVVVAPIYWVSATGELLAAVFALAALDRWLAGGRAGAYSAVVWGTLSILSKEPGLGLSLVLLVALVLVPGAFERKVPRGAATIAVVLLGAIALAEALLVLDRIPHGEGSPYQTGGVATVVSNYGLYGAWLVNPWKFAPNLPGVQAIGAAFWLVWAVFALLHWRRGMRVTAFSLAAALIFLAPPSPMVGHQYPYYLLLAVPAWGWTLGAVVAPLLAHRRVLRRWALVTGCILCALVAFVATRQRLTARGSDGLLRDGRVASMALAAEFGRLVRTIHLAPNTGLYVLQATRETLPGPAEDLEEIQALTVGSPLYTALSGNRGLQLLAGEEVRTGWVSHLDALRPEDTVILDAGDQRIRVLGPRDNARLYSALIAVSAGQFSRARHDLWNVVGPAEPQIPFVYDSDNLPIVPDHLEEQALRFVTFVRGEDDPSNERVLSLFEQLYEAVMGQPLFRRPWGEVETYRPGRR